MIDGLLAALLAVATPSPTPLVVHQYPTPVSIHAQGYFPALVSVPSWMVAERTATPTPRPTVQPLPPVPTPLVARPRTHEELRRAVATPGAYVVPMPAVYHLARNLKLAPRVTLDGDHQVTIVGKTVELYEADGATVRNLRILDAAGDGLRVSHTRSALIEGLTVSGSGDGEIDVVEGPDEGSVMVIIRNTVMGPGRKCQLIGDPDQPQDTQLAVVLDHVTFTDCHVRVPKSHYAWIEMRDSTIYHWSGPRIDAQMGARIRIKNNTWIAGPESLPGYYLPTGGQVEDLGGNVYREWRGQD